jgi:hypothetical protein
LFSLVAQNRDETAWNSDGKNGRERQGNGSEPDANPSKPIISARQICVTETSRGTSIAARAFPAIWLDWAGFSRASDPKNPF